ncbi:MAG: hypothetical protein GF418_10700 [Chitinivibrionales bacterium]|nr:hypothetical protein [Chitinivibrionales bacterium]MBD3396083.1 hypothetical protein [Chitinivibrionales bacterium]
MKPHTRTNQLHGTRTKRTGCIVCLVAFTTMASAQQQSSRRYVSVYGLKAIGISQELAESLQEHLESNLLRYDRFAVLSRSDVDLILEEARFQQAGGCANQDCLLEAGSLLGLHTIVTGTISRLGQTYNVVLKLIDVESGELTSSANGRHTGSVDELLDVTERLLGELLEGGGISLVDTVVVVDTFTTIDTVRTVDTVVAVVTKTREPEYSPSFYYRKEEASPAVGAPDQPAVQGTMPSVKARAIGLGAAGIFGAIAVTLLVHMLVNSNP